MNFMLLIENNLTWSAFVIWMELDIQILQGDKLVDLTMPRIDIQVTDALSFGVTCT